MPLPRRRSSRLRGATATPGKPTICPSNHLDSLTERDETPDAGAQSNLNAIVSSPLCPRTPATAVRVKPSLAEMHPSKAQQSTTKESDSGLLLGFTDIKTSGGNQPSGVTQQTPSKTTVGNSSFEFTFARAVPQLGPEAQRMMDGLREEALRIKAKLAAEREAENQRVGETAGGAGPRKIASAKGKAGRFSDAHMAEFKKMGSIAGHPSAFRAQPSRSAPLKPNLKRTQSRAQLDDREEQKEHTVKKSSSSDRLENTSPAKRARKNVEDDSSSTRPVSRGDNVLFTPIVVHSRSTITTPTQSSLMRTATSKKVDTYIPTLVISPSKPNLLSTPQRLPKLVGTTSTSGIPTSTTKDSLHSQSKLNRVRSILKYPSLSSKKIATIASNIPTLSRSASKPNLNKSLPSLPMTPGGVSGAEVVKHVNFTPNTVEKHATAVQNSPSPMKSGLPRSISRIKFGTKPNPGQPGSKKFEAKEVSYPSLAGHSSLANNVDYPSLAGLADPSHSITLQHCAPPSVPGTFTFRSDHTISFGASPKGFGSSPGQASLRQVRQSILPTSTPISFRAHNKENAKPLPFTAQDVSTKKRRRVDSDDEEDEEVQRSPKKHKAAVAEGRTLLTPKLHTFKTASNSKSNSPAKKKGVLSLSRLNMLARPKNRK